MEKNKSINTLGMFDLLKGLTMILIVFLHTIELYGTGYKNNDLLRIATYGLMTLFFVIGGYNFKPVDIKTCIQQQYRFVFKPYIIFSIMITILLPIVHYLMYGWLPGALTEARKQVIGLVFCFGHTTEIFGQEIYGSGPLWFLIAYTFAWILLNLIFKIRKEWQRTVVICLCFITGYILSLFGHWPFCLSQTLLTVGFLFAGFLIKKLKLLEAKVPWYIYLILVVVGLVGSIFGGFSFSDSTYKLGLLDLICSAAQGFVLLKVVIYANRYENRFFDAIRTIGRYSFWVMFIHTLEFLCFRWYEFTKFIPNPIAGTLAIFAIRSIFILLGCMLWNHINKIKISIKFKKASLNNATKVNGRFKSLLLSFNSELVSDEKAKEAMIRVLFAFCIIFIVNSQITSSPSYFSISDIFPYNSFQFALFAFCIGYFYKKSYEGEVLQYLKKLTLKLLLPLFAWNLLYGCFSEVLKRVAGFSIGDPVTLRTIFISPLTSGHQFSYNLGSWIIFPVLCVCIINIAVRKLLSLLHISNEWLLLGIYLIAGIIGINLASSGTANEYLYPVMRTIFLLPCYQLGVMYKYKLESKDKINSWVYFAVLFTIQIIIIFFIKDILYYPSWMINFVNGPVLPYITAFTGIALWLRTAKILWPVIKNSRLFITIGNNIFNIMMHQILGFFVCNAFWAVAYKLGLGFGNFNMAAFKSDIFYFYFPRSFNHFTIVYIIFGITVPIMIGMMEGKIINRLFKRKIDWKGEAELW